MPRAAAIARAAGGVVISDEVQAGYCRTGRWWGYEVAGFEPDIVVTGKPMGAGLPLAATTATAERLERRWMRSGSPADLLGDYDLAILSYYVRPRFMEMKCGFRSRNATG